MPLTTTLELESRIQQLEDELKEQQKIMTELTNVNAQLLNGSIPTKKDVRQFKTEIERLQKEYIEKVNYQEKVQQQLIEQIKQTDYQLNQRIQSLTSQNIQQQLDEILKYKKRNYWNSLIADNLPHIFGILGIVCIVISFIFWWFK